MAIKPTRQQIETLADRRLVDLGILPPAAGSPSFDRLNDIYQEKRERQILNAELHLTRAHERELAREQDQRAIETERLTRLVEELRGGFMSVPGATEAEFQQALPDLLTERRKLAALNGERSMDADIDRAQANGSYRS